MIEANIGVLRTRSVAAKAPFQSLATQLEIIDTTLALVDDLTSDQKLTMLGLLQDKATACTTAYNAMVTAYTATEPIDDA